MDDCADNIHLGIEKNAEFLDKMKKNLLTMDIAKTLKNSRGKRTTGQFDDDCLKVKPYERENTELRQKV